MALKILHVTPYYYPAIRYGGPIRSVHGLCKELSKLGANVTVYTTNLDGIGDLDVTLQQPIDVEGVNVYYFQVAKPRSFAHSPQMRVMLAKRLREFDIAHVNGLYQYPTMITARACQRQKKPYVISPRGMLDPYAVGRKGTLKKKLYLFLFEKRNLERAAGVHFTVQEEQQLASFWKMRMRGFVVPNALDLSDYTPSTSVEGIANSNVRTEFPTILFLSRIDPKKGLDLLVPAFARVVSSMPAARLIIAGPDNTGYKAEVEALVEQYSLQEKVVFSGMLDGTKKAEAFTAASVFVLPSYSENFGIVVAEAMAYSRPVVMTNRVNLHDEVSRAGAGLITSCDPQSISEALLTILRDPDLGRDMGIRGRKLVEEKFTWRRAASNMLDVYHRLLSP